MKKIFLLLMILVSFSSFGNHDSDCKSEIYSSFEAYEAELFEKVDAGEMYLDHFNVVQMALKGARVEVEEGMHGLSCSFLEDKVRKIKRLATQIQK